MSKRIALSLLLLVSACSAGSGQSESSDQGTQYQEGAKRVPSEAGAPGVIADPGVCAALRIAPDGVCEPEGLYNACDPDCATPEPSEPTNEAGAPNDPCAGGFVVSDGVCGDLACDPDCFNDEPAIDPADDACANVRLAADGQCDVDGEYFACDPDCAGVDPLPEESDPCAAIRIAPDGQCVDGPYVACDPDCFTK